jgi:heparosan-N-sulfate-glucuronate 5-epimerase
MKIIRKFHENDNLYLDLNWNSAMLQGHALSLLTRLYSSTKNIIYLKSALNAVEIFYKSVNNNGVRTYFHDKFIWFEEYPTKPNSIFVLNGFIYSLIGLFDLSNCLKLIKNENYTKVYSLYENGMNSLVNLIMLFDSGTRTFYDLRHITNAPNSGNLFCF